MEKENNKSPEVEPSVRASFSPPAGDMVPAPSKGEWEPVPTRPDSLQPMKGRSDKRTKGKETAVRVKLAAKSGAIRFGKKPTKTGANKKRSHKR
jgi:hypothetical protein